MVAKGKKCSSLYLMQARVIDDFGEEDLLFGMKKGSLKRCSHCLVGK